MNTSGAAHTLVRVGSPTAPPAVICPAAYWLAGPPMSGPSVVCRIMEREDAQDDAILVGEGNPHITVRDDPSIYFGFCTGSQDGSLSGKPRADGSWPQHYTSCPIWQEMKEAVWADRDRAWTPIDRYTQPENDEDFMARINA